ncbi:MAG: sulfatase [Bacteroidota bacterium]
MLRNFLIAASIPLGGLPALAALPGHPLNPLQEPVGLSAGKPNIICILVDDMGWLDTGFMGSEFYETPNLDRLSRMGITFTDAYASASNCAPSRASLMTGQWTPRHGIYTVDSSERGRSRDRMLIPIPNTSRLAESHLTMAEALKDAGYITCSAGKWHLDDNPLNHGFDVNIGGCHAGNPGSYYPPYTMVPLKAPSDDYYLTNLIMDKTLEFLESTSDRPFFLYYAPYAVHTPIQPVRELLPKYAVKPGWNGQENRDYATMIENLDIQVGRLADFLEATGIMENTFILFTSDNGGHYGITRQLPLRSGKGSYYEGGIRVPMFAVWPGRIAPDSRSAVPVSHIDLFPTFMEVAGSGATGKAVNDIQESSGGKLTPCLDGRSLLPLMTDGQEPEVHPLYWHFPIYLEAYLKEGDPTKDPLFRTRPGAAVRSGNFKLIRYFENNDLELYNLQADIGETSNLASVMPGKLQEMIRLLDDWLEYTKAPVPQEFNPDYAPENITE